MTYIGEPVTRVKINRSLQTPITPQLLAHLEMLTSLGMDNYMIARSAGVASTTVRNVRLGRASGSTVDVHNALLSVTPRPSKHQACVLSYGAARRLEGLAVMGWSSGDIGARMGIHPTCVRQVRVRNVITWNSHVAIDGVFESLAHLDGGNLRTKAWATRSNFVHPFLWDDIDDPYEIPTVPEDSDVPDQVVVERLMNGRRVPASNAERRLAVWGLLGRGLSTSSIADVVGVAERTVERYRAVAA